MKSKNASFLHLLCSLQLLQSPAWRSQRALSTAVRMLETVVGCLVPPLEMNGNVRECVRASRPASISIRKAPFEFWKLERLQKLSARNPEQRTKKHVLKTPCRSSKCYSLWLCQGLTLGKAGARARRPGADHCFRAPTRCLGQAAQPAQDPSAATYGCSEPMNHEIAG